MASCSQSDLTAVTIPNVVPSLNLYGKTSNNQRFFLSDNPETISSSVPFTNGYATLWADTASGLQSVTYRMFVWHLNNTGATIKFGVTIGNGSSGSTYQVSGVKDCIETITNFVAHGKCAAKALLGNTLTPSSPVDSSIAAGKVGLVKEWKVPNGYLVGGIIEFTLSSSSPMSYKVRTVAAKSTTADLRSNQNAVVSPVGTHPRGSWNFSNIDGFGTSGGAAALYTVGDGNKSFSINNGINDNLMTKDTSYMPSEAVATNKGHYGVIYKANITFKNPTQADKALKVYLTGRGGSYGGAVRWNNGPTYGVPTLSSNTQGVQIATFTIPKGTSVTHSVYTSTAGSLNTPAAILITE
ncbi:hypothetical protein ACIQ7N_03110 [Lysinibacillus sp. NPDC095746]|uniref:hypothetical protein n=1 Tax=Lysinibacillus sp. NPDC095746 TaxID=3364134 RepID=UPI00381C2192